MEIKGVFGKQIGTHLQIKAILSSKGVLLLKRGLIICFRAGGCIVLICTTLPAILCTDCRKLSQTLVRPVQSLDKANLIHHPAPHVHGPTSIVSNHS